MTALLLSLVPSVLGFNFWPLMTHQRHVRRPNDVNWLQKCLVDLQCPCPLPPGQFPWEREDYDNHLTDVHIVTGASEPDFLRAILQQWKSTVFWVSEIQINITYLLSGATCYPEGWGSL